MKKLDTTSVLAAVVIGLGLVLDELPVEVRAAVVIGALGIFVSVADQHRFPLAIGAVIAVVVIAPNEAPLAAATVVGAAVAGAAAETLLPQRSWADSRERSLLTRIDVEVVDHGRLADLLDREIGRAQRLDHEVAVVSLPLHDHDDDVFAALDSVRSVLRNHDLLAYDADVHSCCVVAVVPSEDAGRIVATKVINVRAVDGSRARTCFYPDNGSTADELLAPMVAWRAPITRREAA